MAQAASPERADASKPVGNRGQTTFFGVDHFANSAKTSARTGVSSGTHERRFIIDDQNLSAGRASLRRINDVYATIIIHQM